MIAQDLTKSKKSRKERCHAETLLFLRDTLVLGETTGHEANNDDDDDDDEEKD